MIVLTEQERTLRAEAITRVLMAGDAASRSGRQLPVGTLLGVLNEAFAPEKGQLNYITRLATVGRLNACRGGIAFYGPSGIAGVCFLGVGQDSGPTLLGGWADTTAMNRDAVGMNVAAYNSARVVARNMFSQSRGLITDLVIYGHSGGGVVAECLGQIMRSDYRFTAAEIQTFGMPKPANGGNYLTISTNRRTRWMNAGDPVPGIPFLATGSRSAIALELAGARYRPDLVRQTPGGRILYMDGRTNFADEADTPMDTTIGNVAAWLIGQDDSGEFPHSLATYNRRLNARLEAGTSMNVPTSAGKTPPITTRVKVEVTSAPEPTPVAQTGTIVAVNGSAARDQGGNRLPWTIGEIPMASQATVAPFLRVRKQRSGGVFMVLWDDVIIGTSGTASGANTVARGINKMCRSFGKTTSLSQASLMAYLQMFLGAAQQVDGGVRPPINVT